MSAAVHVDSTRSNASQTTHGDEFRNEQQHNTNNSKKRKRNQLSPKLGDAAPATTQTKAAAPSKEVKKKRISPFRVKMGCVAALRLQVHGNNVWDDKTGREILPDDSLLHLWANPVQGRDEGYALLGKRVRCFFPSHLVQGKQRRVLEGEVMTLVDGGKRKVGKPWKVELLVERDMLKCFPFLTRVDEDVDVSKLATAKAKRNHQNEIRIRGNNLVVVKMRLLHPGASQTNDCVKWVILKRVPAKLFYVGAAAKKNTTTGEIGELAEGDNRLEEGTLESGDAQQQTLDGTEEVSDTISSNDDGKKASNSAIQPSGQSSNAKQNGLQSSQQINQPVKKRSRATQGIQMRHMGDKVDGLDQQVANWRWVAGRYHDMLLTYGDPDERVELLSGFIGEVIHVAMSTPGSKSLATVTLRRLFLPQHTANTTSISFRNLSVLDDASQAAFRVPIEQLVVIGQKVVRGPQTSEISGSDADTIFTAEYRYFGGSNILDRIDDVENEVFEENCDNLLCCHRCRLALRPDFLQECSKSKCELRASWCESCLEVLVDKSGTSNIRKGLPCCKRSCDCRICQKQSNSQPHDFFVRRISELERRVASHGKSSYHAFEWAKSALDRIGKTNFALPVDFMDHSLSTCPAPKQIKRPKPKAPKRKMFVKRSSNQSPGAENEGEELFEDEPVVEEMDVFKPTCARLIPYDPSIKMSSRANSVNRTKHDRPRSLREVHPRLVTEGEGDEKVTNSRAARAKQRRIVKGVSNLAGLGFDMLSSRESQLRFGRSGIHNWGVYADSEIASGDLIIEYRGEIICNSVAEKREKEYHAAKIGSDYMFRMDKDSVCDATKIGNVARFINASCDPNCYTKIITVEGNKRIVIYAKRDIQAGEELCYDYKFAHEYDEEKRVPCHCGSKNCKGFMNWDKRYVTVPDKSGEVRWENHTE